MPEDVHLERIARELSQRISLDSGEVETSAELARYLGVSRARATQVLNRLDDPLTDRGKDASAVISLVFD